MPERIERAMTIVLTCAALAIAGSVVHREFMQPTPSAKGQGPQNGPPTYLPEWESAQQAGTLIGDSAAIMKVVVLSDLECPFCARFHEQVEAFRAKNPRDVSIVFVHDPLRMHRFALPAARAADCAADVKKFEPFVTAVYSHQDSLGLRSWGRYAQVAGIADTAAIARCASSGNKSKKLTEGLAYAQKIGANATPTVVINGWRFRSAPSTETMTDVLDSLRKGRAPFANRSGPE